MSNITKQHIFVVDDEPGVCEAISETLVESGAEVTCFSCAAECLQILPSQRCDLLITDLKMPEMDGIELMAHAKRLKPSLPTMVVTGYGDIPTAVRAVRAGAADFIEKPLHKESFVDKVESILQGNDNSGCRHGLLTQRELTVLKLVTEGKTNKEMASLLCRSVRTIEVHRSHIMRKLGVNNLVELLKRASARGLVE